jgi:hypothetical protein
MQLTDAPEQSASKSQTASGRRVTFAVREKNLAPSGMSGATTAGVSESERVNH